MHIFRSGKIQVFIQVGDRFALVDHYPPPNTYTHHHHLAITPSLLTITVIQAITWSIDYINLFNTANLNASCLH